MIRGKDFICDSGIWSAGVILVLAVCVIVSGLTNSFSWLTAFDYEYLRAEHSAYARHIEFLRPLFVLAGLVLLLALIGRNYLLSLWDKVQLKPEFSLTLLLILVYFILGYVAYIPFHNYPFSMDEYNYLYQAEIFSRGKLYLEAPQKFAPFLEQYMIFTDGKLFSKYAPGFSAILSLGVLLDLSGWVNPAIATATLLVTFLFIRSFFGSGYALFGVVLMASTPYFIAYSASYFSQPLALFLTSLGFLLVRQYEMTSRHTYLLSVGIVAGYAALTRPLDCFCLIVPSYLYLIYVLHQEKNLVRIAYPIAMFTILFAFFLLYNFRLTGAISIATYPIVEGEFKVVDREAAGVADNMLSIIHGWVDNGRKNIRTLLGEYFLVPTGIFIPIAALLGLIVFRDKWRWVLLVNFALLVLLYNFHGSKGWPQYGARYYYSGLFAVVVIATAGFRWVFQKIDGKLFRFHIFVLLLMTHTVFSVIAIWEYSHRFYVVSIIDDELNTKCGDNSLVFLKTDAAPRRTSPLLQQVRFVSVVDFKRNPFMEEIRLITRYNGPSATEALAVEFPNHSVCVYHFDVVAGDKNVSLPEL